MTAFTEPSGLTEWPPARSLADALVSAVAWSLSPLIACHLVPSVADRVLRIAELDVRPRRSTALRLLLAAPVPVDLATVRRLIFAFGWPSSFDLEGLSIVALDEIVEFRRAALADQLVRGSKAARRAALGALEELERLAS